MPLAAIVGRKNNDVSRDIADMLEAMSYNKRLFSVATDSELVTTRDVRSLDLTEAAVAIGRCGFSTSDARFSTRPFDQKGKLSIALDGYFLGSVNSSCDEAGHGIEWVADIIGERGRTEDLSGAVGSVLPELRGAFSLVVMKGKTVVVARDVFGFEPLYWGEDDWRVAIASEMKALWKIGLRDVVSFPQGCVARVNEGTRVSKVLSLVRPKVVDVSLDVAAGRLVETLSRFFSSDLRRIGEMGLLFSGGVDSSIVAKISCDSGLRAKLYGVAVEGAHDADVIERSASELGFELRLRILSLDEVEDYLRKTVYAVEEANPMSVGIGLPVYVGMEAANADGFEFVLSGQGADELFGGYSRYRRIIKEGYERLHDEMWNDVAHMREVNLQRDSAIAMANNVDCFLPFLDLEVVNLAMSFPVALKVKGPEDMLRKHVLREAAKMLGLPESIAYLPKKAAQYSSGSDMAIRKLAKRGGKSHREYVEDIFKEIFREYCPQT